MITSQSSTLVPPADNHDTSGEVDPSAHGNGPIEVSLSGFPLEVDDIVVNSSKILGGRYAYNEDLNAGCTVGFGLLKTSLLPLRDSSDALIL